MIKDLQHYFKPEQDVFLKEISYKLLKTNQRAGVYNLNCTDTLQVDLNESYGVRVFLSRMLKFDPENMFELVVTFGADLPFEDEKKNELQWSEFNLADEFKDNGGFITNTLAGRASLQIAQITSAVGQPPIITPPGIAGKKDT